MGKFGSALRHAREIHNLSQREAAKAGGISTSTWHAAEQRSSPVGLKPNTVRAISSALGVSEREVMLLGQDVDDDRMRPFADNIPRLMLRLDRIEARLEQVEAMMGRNGDLESAATERASRAPPGRAAK